MRFFLAAWGKRGVLFAIAVAILFFAAIVSRRSDVVRSAHTGVAVVYETVAEVFGMHRKEALYAEIPLGETFDDIEKENVPEVLGREIEKKEDASVPEEVPIRECDISAIGKHSGKIIFSEIDWMGSKENANGEWIELKNVSSGTIALRGWRLVSTEEKIRAAFESGSVEAGETLLLERGEDAVPEVSAALIYSGALSNDGAHLLILEPDCNISDEIDASRGWPAGDNATKQTMERDLKEFFWYTSATPGGTPSAENSQSVLPDAIPETPDALILHTDDTVRAPKPEPKTEAPKETPRILIAEVRITGGEGKSDEDFIRLINVGGEAADIPDWRLKKRTKSGTEYSIKVFGAGASVSPGGAFIWANSKNGFSESTGASVSSTQTLTADSSIALFDPAGNIADSLAWGSGHTSPFVEGAPFPENPGAGVRLTRRTESGVLVDGGNNASDFELRQ